MKKSPRAPRVARRDGLDHRLHGYSKLGAAALATAGAVASAPAVSAQITTITFGPTPPSVTLSSIGTAANTYATAATYFNVGGQPRGFFVKQGNYGDKIAYGYAAVFNLRVLVPSNYNGAARLGWGVPVAPISGRAFSTNVRLFSTRSEATASYRLGRNSRANIGLFGNFLNLNTTRGDGQIVASASKTGYIGFRLGDGVSNFRYGWLHLRVGADADGRPNRISFVPGAGDIVGAYAGIGQSIFAGQLVSAIPEPSVVATGLALFALGAAGIREHRRRKLAA